MGAGKSTAVINYINSCGKFGSDSDTRFIVFVPTITERKRFINETGAKTPDNTNCSKIKSILDMIVSGENIVTTHALCQLFTDETITAFQESEYKYIAFFDEIPSFFNNVVGGTTKRDTENDRIITKFGKADVKLMQTANIVKVENGKIIYNSDSEYGRSEEFNIFDNIKFLGSHCDLFPYGKDKDGYFTSIIAFAKRSIFECFHEIWFCSYLTKGSMIENYCQLNDIDMIYYHIDDNCNVVKNPDGLYYESYPEGLERLEILELPKFNMNNSLSKQWYSKAKNEHNKTSMKVLEGKFRSAYEYMKKHSVTAKTFIWTLFKEYKEVLKVNGRLIPVNKTWIPCNTKATNDYSGCTGIAYLCNRYFDRNCYNYLSQLAIEKQNDKIKFNDDIYALSELIQFIWRSNIRIKNSSKKIYVWIPDNRMRNLLFDFIGKAKKSYQAKIA